MGLARKWYFPIVLVAVIDCLSTYFLFWKMGGYERIPVPSYIIENLGLTPGLPLAMLLAISCVITLGLGAEKVVGRWSSGKARDGRQARNIWVILYAITGLGFAIYNVMEALG
mgnify:CR=1 FL=1